MYILHDEHCNTPVPSQQHQLLFKMCIHTNQNLFVSARQDRGS